MVRFPLVSFFASFRPAKKYTASIPYAKATIQYADCLTIRRCQIRVIVSNNNYSYYARGLKDLVKWVILTHFAGILE